MRLDPNKYWHPGIRLKLGVMETMEWPRKLQNSQSKRSFVS